MTDMTTTFTRQAKQAPRKTTVAATIVGRVDSPDGEVIEFRATDGTDTFFVVAPNFPGAVPQDGTGTRLMLTGRFVGGWFDAQAVVLVARAEDLVAA